MVWISCLEASRIVLFEALFYFVISIMLYMFVIFYCLVMKLLLVKDVMQRSVITVSPKMNVKRVADLMNAKHIGCVIVVSEDKEPIGIITERDLLVEVVSACENPRELVARQVMSTELIVVRADASLQDAAKLMKINGIKKLPVIEEGSLIGIITTTDIALNSPDMIDYLLSIIRSGKTPPHLRKGQIKNPL